MHNRDRLAVGIEVFFLLVVAPAVCPQFSALGSPFSLCSFDRQKMLEKKKQQ
jgi:hypothetical protein